MSLGKTMKKYVLILLSGIVINCQAEQIKSIVEFFSYTCSHCANVNKGVFTQPLKSVKF